MTTEPRATDASSPLAGLDGVDGDSSASADGPRERHAPGSEVIGAGSRQEVIQGYERSPKDVLRVVVFAVTTLVFLGVTLWAEDAVLGFERDLIELLAFLSSSVERVVHGVLVVAMLLVQVVALVVPLVLRRYRLFGYLFGAIVLSATLMALAQAAVDRSDPTVLVNVIAQRAGLDDATLGGVIMIAQTAAVFVAFGPFVSRRWRITGAITIALLAVTRVMVSVHLPTEVLVAIPLGATAGTAVLLAFGRPDARPTTSAVRRALVDTGLHVAEVTPAKVDARGSTPYFALLDGGSRLFVKVLGEEERAADLLFRLYRFLRLKDVGDDRPFSSLRRAVEHEAFVSLAARDVGVRTPRMRGVVSVGTDSMLLAYDLVAGTSIDRSTADEITDELMRSVWEQIAVLRRHRIAHRDLRRANVFLASDGEPWIIDFGFAELAVDESLLDADVAQMLASFAVVTGPERSVAAAVDVLGRDAVAAALPRLQLRALSGATQTALKSQKGLLEGVRDEVMRRCDTGEIPLADLERVNRKTLFMLAVLTGALYFLLPQFADLPGIVDQIRDAEWQWAPLVVGMSVITYVGATASLAGAIPQRLPTGPLFTAQVGSSFASKLAPAGLGGMALNVRFLQRQGVDRAVAVSGVGLNSIAGLVGHVTLVVVFVVWAGRSAFGSFELPDPKWFVIGLAAAGALVVIGLVIPVTRRLVLGRLVPILRRSVDGVTSVLRQPTKVVALIGGSVVVTMSYLLALYFATQAFGGGLPLATVGAIFLVGSAVAQAAPTPGGLGAVEAAMIGGLVAAGMDNSIAIPAVFMYRLATFWLPVLPGWLCFTWLERHEYL